MEHQNPIGRVLEGRYRLEAPIARGGMGAVYRAVHLLLGRPVAIKILVPERTADPLMVERFAREARNTFRFDNPHCVRVTDFGGTEDGLLYLVMEFLEGRTLAEELAKQGAVSHNRAVHVGAQICDALAHTHSRGIVHRDLKPENVMLLHRGEDPDYVKVLDFGLAKIFDADAALASTYSVASLTQHGLVYGTPEYMSPEQASGSEIGPSSDIYSLGVLLYQMVSNILPFEGTNFMEILTRRIREEPPPPSARRPDLRIPARLEQVVMQCLTRDPSDRPAHVSALKQLLVESLTLPTTTSVSRVPAALAGSPTLDLTDASPARLLIADPTPPVGEAAAELARPGRRSRRRIGKMVAGIGLITAGAVVGLSWGSGSGLRVNPNQDTDQSRDAPPAPATPPTPTPATRTAPSRNSDVDGNRSGTAAPAPNRGEKTPQREADHHLALAEQAYRQGKPLTQLAQAKVARDLDHTLRRARFLIGDALLKLGDKKQGCAYLKPWPERLSAGGCGN
jgi:serine/threonine-protein kinase